MNAPTNRNNHPRVIGGIASAIAALPIAVPDSTAPHQAQIQVADGAALDFETKSTYELILCMNDDEDHESKLQWHFAGS